jgi:hypothetical protein
MEPGDLDVGTYRTTLSFQSMPITPEMRRTVVEKGVPRFAVEKAKPKPAKPEPAAPRITEESVKQSFKGSKVDKAAGGYRVTLPDGRTVYVLEAGHIAMDLEAFRETYRREPKPTETIIGVYRGMDAHIGIPLGGVIQLAKGRATKATLDHEVFHAAVNMALWEERAAKAYEKWDGVAEAPTFHKVRRYFKRIWKGMGEPTAEGVFERVRAGEAFRGERVGVGRGRAKFAVADSAKLQRRKKKLRAEIDSIGRQITALKPGTPEAMAEFKKLTSQRKKLAGEIEEIDAGLFKAPTPEPVAPKTEVALGWPAPLKAHWAGKDTINFMYPGKGGADTFLISAKVKDGKLIDPEGRVAEYVEEMGGSMSAAQDAVTSVLRRYPGQEEFFGKKAGPKFAVEEEMDTGRVPPGSVKAGLRKPRVEQRVKDLDEARQKAGKPPITLDRDTVQTWKSLDPKVQEILKTYSEEKFHEIMVKRRLEPEESMAWDAVLKGREERVTLLDEQAAAERNPQKKSALEKEMLAETLLYVAGQRAMIKDGTGLGRAMAARARLMKGKTLNQGLLRSIFKDIPGISVEDAATLMRAIKTDPAAARKILEEAIPSTKWNKLLEYWKAGILSGLGTHARNFFGNAMEHAVRAGETVVAPFAEKGLQKLTERGKREARKGVQQRERFSGEAWAEMLATKAATPEAFRKLTRNLWNAVRHLEDRPLDVTRRFEHQLGAIRGKKGKVIRLPFRALEVGDAFFKDIGGAAELGKLAYRMARKEGKTGTRLKQRTAEILRDVADPNKGEMAEMREILELAKLDRTFQTRRRKGTVEAAIRDFKRGIRPAEFVFPFVMTPGNILRLTWQRSPFGMIKANQALGDYKAGKISSGEAADIMARPLLGNAMLLAFFGMAAENLLTGSGPEDWKQKQTKRETGWQPDSVRIPAPMNPLSDDDMYIPIAGFEPLASLMSFAANMVEAGTQKEKGEILQRVGGSVKDTFLANKSYLRGAGELARAWDPRSNYAATYVANLAGSFVPNIVAKAAQAVDPAWRETRPEDKAITGVHERTLRKIQSRIPFASRALPARKTATGREVVSMAEPFGALQRFAAPSKITFDQPGREVERLMVDIGYVPSQPGREISIKKVKVRLSDELYTFYQEAMSSAAEKVRKKIKTNASFGRMTDVEKEDVIKDIYTNEKRRYRNRILRMPEFLKLARKAYQEAQRGR